MTIDEAPEPVFVYHFCSTIKDAYLQHRDIWLVLSTKPVECVFFFWTWICPSLIRCTLVYTMPENSNPRKRRRSREEEADEDRIHMVAAGPSTSTALVKKSSTDVLPAGTFNSQWAVKAETLASRSDSASPRTARRLTSSTLADGSGHTSTACQLTEVASSVTLGLVMRDYLLLTLSSIENVRVDHHVQITDENAVDGIPSSAVSGGYPEFLRSYGNLVLDQTRCLEKTCRVVLDAVSRIFKDEFDSAAQFARRGISCTLDQPCTPKLSLDEVLAATRQDFDDTTQRMKAFSTHLPGFALFSQDDQKTILATRYIERHLFHRAPRMKNSSMQYCLGEKKIHVCPSWLDLLDTKQHFLLVDSVNSLHLNHAESYLSLCLALFRPGSDMIIHNQGLMRFLYAHYLDVFHHLVSSRFRGLRDFYTKYETVVSETPTAYHPDIFKQIAQSSVKESGQR